LGVTPKETLSFEALATIISFGKEAKLNFEINFVPELMP
jgi:hypothetical protein